MALAYCRERRRRIRRRPRLQIRRRHFRHDSWPCWISWDASGPCRAPPLSLRPVASEACWGGSGRNEGISQRTQMRAERLSGAASRRPLLKRPANGAPSWPGALRDEAIQRLCRAKAGLLRPRETLRVSRGLAMTKEKSGSQIGERRFVVLRLRTKDKRSVPDFADQSKKPPNGFPRGG